MDSVWLRMHNSIIRRFSAVVAVAVLALSFSACSSSGSTATKSATGGITIANFAFKTSSVKAGSTVTVTNNDTRTHTVTSNDGTSFNVTVDAGKTATFTAPPAGSYDFHCNIHKTMKSKLTVT
jgi:plastocyanin